MGGKVSDYRAEFYDKSKLKKENPRMFPPPRKPTSHRDAGLLHRPSKGLGMRDAKGSGGSYPLYRSADALEFAVNAYFGLKIEQEKPPTMAGLALALGFKSTKSLKDYETKGEAYSDILEVARTRVEEWKNELLLEGGKSATGVIFDLKNNHGWAEKVEQHTTVEAGDTLSQLLLALQGKVLRPAIDGQASRTGIAEDAEYRDDEGDEDITDPHEDLAPQASPSKKLMSFEEIEAELEISLPGTDVSDLI